MFLRVLGFLKQTPQTELCMAGWSFGVWGIFLDYLRASNDTANIFFSIQDDMDFLVFKESISVFLVCDTMNSAINGR